MTIETEYRRLHPGSSERYVRAMQTFPNGVTHDGRFVAPFPLYVERSAGPHKWDVDGNRLIDYVTGHGSLLLGHAHPAIVAAVAEQMTRGTHYGAEHDLELRWAEIVMRLFPSIERLRFTASGTEATMLALRLARAYTGRTTVIRLTGHYHGWHDMLTRDAPTDPSAAGVPDSLLGTTLVLPAELNQIEHAIVERRDIAAVILEPTGASYGAVPLAEGFLRQLRALASAHDVVLIFDEVVTGFRVLPGGVQQRAGVRADLTTLAKVLAGGLPGGAVGGRADIMHHLEFADTAWNQEHKIRHNGTFNANPLSAAAGVAMLERVADGELCDLATAACRRLIRRMNAVLRERELAGWAVYGDASIFHLLAGSKVEFAPGELSREVPIAELKSGGDTQVLQKVRLGLNNHGVDLMRGRSGFLSSAHSEAELEATAEAFAATLDEI